MVELSRRHPDPRHRWDLGRAPPPPELLAGCDVIVNLVGIKRGRRSQFEAAHVYAVRHLLVAARICGVRRFVHVSVALHPGLPDTPYVATKRRGEAEVLESGLPAVVVRPNVVFGPGDDFVRNTWRSLQLSAAVPVPADARPVVPVSVADVARTIVQAAVGDLPPGTIATPSGPEPLHLSDVVVRVARSMDLRGVPVAVPPSLLGLAAVCLSATFDPLVTRSQLDLLRAGLPGDPAWPPGTHRLDATAIRRSLDGVETLTYATAAAGRIARRLAIAADRRIRFVVLLLVGMAVAFYGLARLALPVWSVVGIATPVAAALAWRALPATMASLLGAPVAGWLRALAEALVVGTSTAVFAGIALSPAAPAMVVDAFAPVRALLLAVPATAAALALPLVVFTEDLVFRGVVHLALVGRLGPVAGIAAAAFAFAAVHAAFGAPPALLFAAVGCGFLWNLLVVRHASLWPAFGAHLLLDYVVLATVLT